MNDRYPAPTVEANSSPLVESLAERMDLSIGEASTVMGSVLTELMRRALRGGIMQLGEQLNDFVGEKVDATIAERTPAVEQAAIDVADVTARSAATEVAREEVQVVARKADDLGRQLTSQIADTASAARQATADAARELSGKIEFAERKAELATAGISLELTNQIKETEQRAIETAHADTLQQLDDYRNRARQGALTMKSRIKRLDASLEALTKQISADQGQLLERLAQDEVGRQAAEERLRGEFTRAVEAAQTQARVEVEKLTQLVRQLTERVAELERPSWLRRVVTKLAFWRKKK